MKSAKRDNWASVDSIVKKAVSSERAIPILKDLFSHKARMSTRRHGSPVCWSVSAGDRDAYLTGDFRRRAKRERNIESDVPVSPALPLTPEGKGGTGKTLARIYCMGQKPTTFLLRRRQKRRTTLYTRSKWGCWQNPEIPERSRFFEEGYLPGTSWLRQHRPMGLGNPRRSRFDTADFGSVQEGSSPGRQVPLQCPLLLFHDPEAQSVAEPYLPRNLIDALHEKKQGPGLQAHFAVSAAVAGAA